MMVVGVSPIGAVVSLLKSAAVHELGITFSAISLARLVVKLPSSFSACPRQSMSGPRESSGITTLTDAIPLFT